MSGGSFDYSYRHVEDMADRLRASDNPQYQAFADHLTKVAAAMKAVEWEFSGDSGLEEAYEAISRVIHPADPVISAAKTLEAMLGNLRSSADHLEGVLGTVKSHQED